jgi:mannosyltransferase
VHTLSTGRRSIGSWWPLAALVALAAALRLATLGEQSFWYDEAFSAVHVFHPTLGATLRAVAHTENSPPLWYLIGWLDVRALGDGAFALRLPSALAGIATVPVAWAIGEQLQGRRAAVIAAALVAVNPLFVWYSQEARVYALLVLVSALAMLCFLRALEEPSRGRMTAFALSGALALLTHYFTVFMLAAMVLVLLLEPARRRAALAATTAIAAVGAALLPLLIEQGGHGTQWIGRWALSSRVEAIPQYFLVGYSGAPLGHGIELLIALPVLLALALGTWALRAGAQARAAAGARIALVLLAAGVLAPLALALAGADYLAPRNLVGSMVPLTALLAVLLAAALDAAPADRAGAGGIRAAAVGLACVIALAFAAVTIDVALSPRLQRGNWRGVARALRPVGTQTALATVELGGAPLRYYLGGLHNLRRGATVLVSEIDEIGYAPLRAGARRPPAAGFRLVSRGAVDGLITYRFRAPAARAVSDTELRRSVITRARPEVLVAQGAP